MADGPLSPWWGGWCHSHQSLSTMWTYKPRLIGSVDFPDKASDPVYVKSLHFKMLKTNLKF